MISLTFDFTKGQYGVWTMSDTESEPNNFDFFGYCGAIYSDTAQLSDRPCDLRFRFACDLCKFCHTLGPPNVTSVSHHPGNYFLVLTNKCHTFVTFNLILMKFGPTCIHWRPHDQIMFESLRKEKHI